MTAEGDGQASGGRKRSCPRVEAGPAKPAVCVYTKDFLPRTETFVYRQLLGVQDSWEPFVITTVRENPALFPFFPLCELPRDWVTRKGERFFDRALRGRVAPLWGERRRKSERAIADRSPRLIHAQFAPNALEVLPLARKARIPLLVTFHGYDASTLLSGRGYRSQLRDLFSYAHILTVSRDMADRLLAHGADPARLLVHYIGVPLETFPFRTRVALPDKVAAGEPAELLQVSSFNEKKGHVYTVAAFRLFLRDNPHARLTLVGDGPQRDHIRSLTEDLAERGAIRFLGPLPEQEVAKVLGQCDIFVHHSVTSHTGDKEGIPIALMEAMASGLIVVSTRHSGIPELVEDGVEGYLVEERDVKAYAAAMQKTLTSGPKMGAAARRKIELNFDMDRQNRLLGEIYQQVADARR